ncbi:(Fe-S)-binding protein, partial [Candidatus Bathyarchaeota archaeon]
RELIWHSGLTLVEMRKNKANSACCGYGHLNFLAYPELSDTIARRRVLEALDTGADVLLTACPSCLHALSRAAREVARGLAVSDVSEVLAELAT